MSKKRSGTCIWCGPGRVNREDVIARWIGEELQSLVPPHEKVIHDISPTEAIELGSTVHPRWKVKKIGRANGPKRFIVCPTCNGGWMSVLENRAKPVLTPLMLGSDYPSRSVLGAESVAIINTWMTKTAIIMDSAEDTPEVIPQSIRDAFWRSPRPLAGTRIWIAGYDAEYGHLSSRHILKIKRANSDGAHHDTLLLATVVLGYLVLQFLPDGSIGTPQRRPMPNDLCIETWPYLSSRDWPSKDVLDPQSLDVFAIPEVLRPQPPT